MYVDNREPGVITSVYVWGSINPTGAVCTFPHSLLSVLISWVLMKTVYKMFIIIYLDVTQSFVNISTLIIVAAAKC